MVYKHNPSTVNELPTNAIGTYHLADNPDIYEIQRSNNFEFVVTGLDNIQRAGTLGMENSAVIKNAQEVIRLSVASCPIPHFDQSVIELRRGNSVLKYAGVPSFPSGQVVLNDFIGANTKEALMAWQNKSYDVTTEKVGLVEDYKKTCYLLEYSPDYQLIRTWKLFGCWISSLSEQDYNNDQNNIHQITATIQYDHAQIDTSSIE